MLTGKFSPSEKYSKKFYESIQSGGVNSARKITPFLLSNLQTKSVIDVGCGCGAWLKTFQEQGLTDLLGIDGGWAKESFLLEKKQFIETDLSKDFSLHRSFDLVVSLEVAEHLPEERAAGFVRDLTNLGEIVLFSAAIPGQGGVNHVNERPPTYWSNLFRDFGFFPCQFFRLLFWEENDVDWWYQQNLLVFFKQPEVREKFHQKVLTSLEEIHQIPCLVHPKFLSLVSEAHENPSIRNFIRFSRRYLYRKLFEKLKIWKL